MNEKKSKKLGRPFERKVLPQFALTHEQLYCFLTLLKKDGGVCIPEFGTMFIRSIKARRLRHNRSNKIITIAAHKKLHFVMEHGVIERIAKL